MKTINKEDYQALLEDAEVLAADGHGEKVLKLKNNHIIKLFRRKRLFSSALIYPYAKRFSNNVAQLTKLGIPTVSHVSVFLVPSISRIAVEYQPLPGDSLDDIIQKKQFGDELIQQFATFLAQLHNLGVYFRSIHLGNVISTPENKLGLIDVSDMKIYSRALPAALCARNIRHFCRYPAHVEALFPQGQKNLFMASYLETLNVSDKKKRQYQSALVKQIDKYDVETN